MMVQGASRRPGRKVAARRRPRPAYLVSFSRPFRHDEDTDLIDGIYLDHEGGRLGAIFLPADRPRVMLDHFVVLLSEGVVAVHAESAFEADHRVVCYEGVAALVYQPDEVPPTEVLRLGERWNGGDEVAVVFETEEDALLAQG